MKRFTQSLFGYRKKEVNLFLTKVEELQNNIKMMQKLLVFLNTKNHELVGAIEKMVLELQFISKEEVKLKEQAWRRLQG